MIDIKKPKIYIGIGVPLVSALLLAGIYFSRAEKVEQVKSSDPVVRRTRTTQEETTTVRREPKPSVVKPEIERKQREAEDETEIKRRTRNRNDKQEVKKKIAPAA